MPSPRWMSLRKSTTSDKDLPFKTIEPPIISHLVITRKYKIEKQIEDNKEVFRDVFDKWKARLVFNGKRQVEHGETFSPTPNMSTIMLLLSVCCTLVWDVQHWDLGNAFCGTELKRQRHLRQTTTRLTQHQTWHLLADQEVGIQTTREQQRILQRLHEAGPILQAK